MNWQPIETAPKDGSRFLVFYPLRNVRVAYWQDDRHNSKPRPYFTGDLEFTHGKGWMRNNPPTHWMPLPEPPVDIS